MLNGLLFFLPLYSYTAAGFTDPRHEGVRQFIPLFIVAAVATLLPLVAIFFFLERKRQKAMVYVSMLASLSVVAVMMMRVSSLKHGEPPATEVVYALPGILTGVILALARALGEAAGELHR